MMVRVKLQSRITGDNINIPIPVVGIRKDEKCKRGDEIKKLKKILLMGEGSMKVGGYEVMR